MDFEKHYRDNQNGMHFGMWADDVPRQKGRADALDILDNAHALTMDRDMRTDEVKAALAYLGASVVREAPFTLFWDGLFMEDPSIRWEALNRALKGIRRELGCYQKNRF